MEFLKLNFHNLLILFILYVKIVVNPRNFRWGRAMFENIENLKIRTIMHTTARTHGHSQRRKVNSFSIRLDGTRNYYIDNEVYTVNGGEVIFLPKDIAYSFSDVSEEPSKGLVINFDNEFEETFPSVYSLDDFYEADYLKNHIVDLWRLGDSSEKYKCMSLVYSLISYVANIENGRYSDKKKFAIIDPAIKYLKKHIYDTSLKTNNLHELCGVSDTYFRKIFISKFGTSPKNYIIEKRVLHAKSIIDSGDFTTVKELALTVGYKDALYFGKIFKKHFGMSAIEMNK